MTSLFFRVDDEDDGFDLVPFPAWVRIEMTPALGGPDSAELWANLGIDNRPRDTHPEP